MLYHFRCGEKEEPRVWVCHAAGGLGGGCPRQTWGESDLKDRPGLIIQFESIHSLQFKREKSDVWCVYFWCLQAIILEGSYWKRRIEVVIKEYHKWRIYYKKRVSNWPNIMGHNCVLYAQNTFGTFTDTLPFNIFVLLRCFWKKSAHQGSIY